MKSDIRATIGVYHEPTLPEYVAFACRCFAPDPAHPGSFLSDHAFADFEIHAQTDVRALAECAAHKRYDAWYGWGPRSVSRPLDTREVIALGKRMAKLDRGIARVCERLGTPANLTDYLAAAFVAGGVRTVSVRWETTLRQPKILADATPRDAFGFIGARTVELILAHKPAGVSA